MAYTTNALVLDIIGPYVNTTTDLPTAEIDAHITRVDSKIRDRLGGLFYPFNALASTPDTPGMVQEISRHWSIAESLRQIVGVNNMSAMDLAAKHEAIAMNLLNSISESPETWMDPETKSGELLTFGTASALPWKLQIDQAFLAATSPLDSGDPPNILPSTVRCVTGTVTGSPGFVAGDLAYLRNGYEFLVSYDSGWQKWVFTAFDSRLYTNVTAGTLSVTYNWNYRRIRGSETVTDEEGGTLMSEFA